MALLFKTYDRLLGDCKTINQLRGLQASLERFITPLEREFFIRQIIGSSSLVERLLARFPPISAVLSKLPLRQVFAEVIKIQSASWAYDLRKKQALSPISSISNFQRVENRRGFILYRSGERKTAVLMVCWQGLAGRLMMPIADFLQALPGGVDVLLIKYVRPGGYAAGVPGLGTNLPDAILGLGKKVHTLNYKTVISLGTSGGTIPALMSCRETLSQRVILLGAYDPKASGGHALWGSFLDQWKRATEMEQQLPEILFMAGADSERDVASANSLQATFGGEVHLLPDAAHNVLYPLLLKGTLAKWLDSAIFPHRGKGK